MPSKRPVIGGRQLVALVMSAGLLLSDLAPAIAADPAVGLASQLPQTIAQLNPIAVAADSLLGGAIDKGNKALEERLRQLHAILNEAIFSLQTALNYGVDKMSVEMAGHIRALNTNAQNLIAKYGVLTTATLDQAQQYVSDDIADAGRGLGNAIAQIDLLNTTSVVSVPTSGFALIRGSGETTDLYVAGVGLMKKGEAPLAGIFDEHGKEHSVGVLAPSMSLVRLAIPNQVMARPATYILKLYFYSDTTLLGYGHKVYRPQQFPVLVCEPARFRVRTRIWVEGMAWETRTRPMTTGNLGDGTIFGIQVPGGNQNVPREITAEAAPGWELYDPGWGRVINCVQNSANGYTAMSHTSHSCYLYVDGRAGNAHLNVVAYVGERRRVARTECAPPFVDERELRGYVTSTFPFDQSSLTGACDVGSPLKSLVTLDNDATNRLDGLLADRQVEVHIADGLVSLKSNPMCKPRKFGEVIVLHPPRGAGQ